MPLAAYGGRADIMSCVAPLGPVYQAGTLSGNPVAVAAGLATIAHLVPELYARLERLGAQLEDGLRGAAAQRGRARHRAARGLDDHPLLPRGAGALLERRGHQ